MRRLIVTEFVSLDGVMEGPGGEAGYAHAGWVQPFMGADTLQYKLTEVLEAESLFIGRVTYETFAEAWPKRTGEFADKMNGMPKYVVSTKLRDAVWNNSSIVRGDVAGEIAKLKKRKGGPLLVAGSRTLVHSLMKLGLVDEYRFMVFPVILGSGRRVFPDSAEPRRLRLTDRRAFSGGVVAHHYEPVS
jgi:dihydrofolate reductase